MIKKLVESYAELKNERSFLKLLAANLISRMGDSIDYLAFQWILYETTKNPTLIAITAGVNFLPNLLFMPFTGVVVEKINKKRLMVLCDIVRAVSVSLVLTLLILERLNPALILCVTFLNSTLESFRIPAGIALRPYVLSQKNCAIGMAANASVSRIAELVGMAIGGAIIAVSVNLAIIIDAFSFLFSAGMISAISYKERASATRQAKKASTFWLDMKAGLAYLASNRAILYLALFGAVMNICGAPLDSFKAIYIADSLKFGKEEFSIVSVAASCGLSLGAFLAPRLQTVLGGRKIYGISGVCFGVVYFLLAALPFWNISIVATMAIAGIVMAVNGMLNGVIGVIFNTAFFTRIDDDYLGRVGGVFGSITVASIPISQFLFAGLSSFLSIPAIFLIGAVLSVVCYSLVYLPKELRDL